MSDHLSRMLIDHLIDRQVCSPPQNSCRNDSRIEDAIAALTAAEEENARLREALRQIAEAHHMMIEPDLRRIARAALEGEGK